MSDTAKLCRRCSLPRAQHVDVTGLGLACPVQVTLFAEDDRERLRIAAQARECCAEDLTAARKEIAALRAVVDALPRWRDTIGLVLGMVGDEADHNEKLGEALRVLDEMADAVRRLEGR